MKKLNTEAELYAGVYIPASNYMFKVNNRNTRRCERPGVRINRSNDE